MAAQCWWYRDLSNDFVKNESLICLDSIHSARSKGIVFHPSCSMKACLKKAAAERECPCAGCRALRFQIDKEFSETSRDFFEVVDWSTLSQVYRDAYPKVL